MEATAPARPLRRRDPADTLLSCEPRVTGNISGVFALQAKSGASSLKLYPLDGAWKRDKEAYVYGLLRAQTTVPVPRILASGDAGDSLDRPWALLEMLPGVDLDTLPDAGPRRAMGALHRIIHDISCPDFGYI